MKKKHIAILGGGYTGLVAAYELSKMNYKVTLIEKESELGGLVRPFKLSNGSLVERFYHHWFKSDIYIMDLIKELGLTDKVIWTNPKTGFYYLNKVYKLSSPLDLLKFKLLRFDDRIRLGLLTIKSRLISNWKTIEQLTAKNWIIKNAGNNVYAAVWKPLLEGKFGKYSSEISAVWIWNKLKLRGGSRNKKGEESLGYMKGGFHTLTKELIKNLRKLDVKIITDSEVVSIEHNNEIISGVVLKENLKIDCDTVLSTIPGTLTERIINRSGFNQREDLSLYCKKLKDIEYIGNVCLIIVLRKPLSDLYWTNVSDPNFPFVGVIEHTNLDSKKNYGNKHIVYISKYLPTSDSLFKMNDKEYYEFAIPFLEQMFENFSKEIIEEYYVWREKHSQPIVTVKYSEKIPEYVSPIKNMYVCNMTQIYPEDRGTNYAAQQAKKIANIIFASK